MTEDEAKQKWCPHMRVAAAHKEFSYNVDFDGDLKSSLCVASECMMWKPETIEKMLISDMEIVKGGYCGLTK